MPLSDGSFFQGRHASDDHLCNANRPPRSRCAFQWLCLACHPRSRMVGHPALDEDNGHRRYGMNGSLRWATALVYMDHKFTMDNLQWTETSQGSRPWEILVERDPERKQTTDIIAMDRPELFAQAFRAPPAWPSCR